MQQTNSKNVKEGGYYRISGVNNAVKVIRNSGDTIEVMNRHGIAWSVPVTALGRKVDPAKHFKEVTCVPGFLPAWVVFPHPVKGPGVLGADDIIREQ